MSLVFYGFTRLLLPKATSPKVKYHISTNTDTTTWTSTTGNKLVVNCQIVANTNSTNSNSTTGSK